MPHVAKGQGRIQGISIVGPVTDEALEQLIYEPGVESWGDERDLVSPAEAAQMAQAARGRPEQSATSV